jgi:hypothetical protein
VSRSLSQVAWEFSNESVFRTGLLNVSCTMNGICYLKKKKIKKATTEIVPRWFESGATSLETRIRSHAEVSTSKCLPDQKPANGSGAGRAGAPECLNQSHEASLRAAQGNLSPPAPPNARPPRQGDRTNSSIAATERGP